MVKTIAFSDACRMRIKRNSVRKSNKSVQNTNNTFDKRTNNVRNVNNIVRKSDGTYLEYTMESENKPCPSCLREGRIQDDSDSMFAFFCPKCVKGYN